MPYTAGWEVVMGRFFGDERGATSSEYGLISALVVLGSA